MGTPANTPQNYFVLGQAPLDAKMVFANKQEFFTLKQSNPTTYAFNFYKGMVVYFQKEEEYYIWELIYSKFQDEHDRIDNIDFQYPPGSIYNNIDYSGKAFNLIAHSFNKENLGSWIPNADEREVVVYINDITIGDPFAKEQLLNEWPNADRIVFSAGTVQGIKLFGNQIALNQEISLSDWEEMTYEIWNNTPGFEQVATMLVIMQGENIDYTVYTGKIYGNSFKELRIIHQDAEARFKNSCYLVPVGANTFDIWIRDSENVLRKFSDNIPVFNFNPGDYDLSEFTNVGPDPYVHISALGSKANVDASNLSLQNINDWKEKIETLTSIQQPQLVGNILTIYYTGENNVQQSQTVDLSGIITNDVHIDNATYDASQNILTIFQNDGTSFSIDLSEFSIIPVTNPDGSVSLNQEGVEKVLIHKVGITGSYNDLTNKPTPTLYPVVRLLEFYQDASNYYIRVAVTNLPTMSWSGSPYYEVRIGSSAILAVDVTETHAVSDTGNTVDPFMVGGLMSVLTIPKATNTSGLWNADFATITVTWKGTDILDGGSASPYNPRRIASDTSTILKLQPAIRDDFSKFSRIRDVVYSYDATNYYIDGNCDIACSRDLANNTAALTMTNFSFANTTVTGTGITMSIVGMPNFYFPQNLPNFVGGLDHLGYTTFPFRITIPKSTNAAPGYNNGGTWISFLLQYQGFAFAKRQPITVPYAFKALFTKPYKEYSALMVFQDTTYAPAFIVQKINTLGNISWIRTGVGQYEGTLTGAFLTNKVSVIGQINVTDGLAPILIRAGRLDDNRLFLTLVRSNDGSVTDLSGGALAVGVIDITVNL